MLRRALTRFAPPATLPGNKSLKDHDPDLFSLIQTERQRQMHGLELIASENFTSRAVIECLGSTLTNKYAEGLPGARYYGGSGVVDQIENLCRKRALDAYNLDPAEWGVNVQPYSGSPANFEVFTALLNPHDRLMGLDLPAGGHLTHGFYTAKRRVSASSVYFESLPYGITDEGVIDHESLDKQAQLFKPKLIIAGGSAYTRDWDYAKYRATCDKVGAYFMVDMAHYSGLVATGEHTSPFTNGADVVTSTTHKTLRGPRSGLIFFKKHLEEKINTAVFPSLQGGPHMHQIAAVATQLKEVASPEFKEYIQQVKRNAKALAESLKGNGYKLVGDGTENHLLLWNLRPQNLTGSKMEKLYDFAEITVNKNSIVGDKSAITPGGLRLGTPALTTRGMNEEDFKRIGEFLHEGVKIGQSINKDGMKLAEFVAACGEEKSVKDLHKAVVDFASKFPFPGDEEPFPVKA